MSYEFITVHTEADKVGVITLNRPKQLNALNAGLMIELGLSLALPDTKANSTWRLVMDNPKLVSRWLGL